MQKRKRLIIVKLHVYQTYFSLSGVMAPNNTVELLIFNLFRFKNVFQKIKIIDAFDN